MGFNDEYTKLFGFDCWWYNIVPTGSFHNCDPPVKNTDRDYLFYIPTSYVEFGQVLLAAGWTLTEANPDNPKANSIPQKKSAIAQAAAPVSISAATTPLEEKIAATDFQSWRKDNLNIIATTDANLWTKHRVAGFVCKKLNLLDKDDRILVYHAVIHGEFDGPEPSFKKKEIDFLALNKMMCT